MRWIPGMKLSHVVDYLRVTTVWTGNWMFEKGLCTHDGSCVTDDIENDVLRTDLSDQDKQQLLPLVSELRGCYGEVLFSLSNAHVFNIAGFGNIHRPDRAPEILGVKLGQGSIHTSPDALREINAVYEAKFRARSRGKGLDPDLAETQMEYTYLFLAHGFAAASGMYDRVARVIDWMLRGTLAERCDYKKVLRRADAVFAELSRATEDEDWELLRRSNDWRREVARVRNKVVHRHSLRAKSVWHLAKYSALRNAEEVDYMDSDALIDSLVTACRNIEIVVGSLRCFIDRFASRRHLPRLRGSHGRKRE